MTKDLTKGKIFPLLFRFTLPLIAGNLFQLTYNAVDSIIVGRFVNKEALAAVGICNPIMTLMILFLNGLCIGAGTLMGTQYGAKEYDTLKRQISTTMLSGVVFSVILSVICIIAAPLFLTLMQVKPAIMNITISYLRIVFVGTTFTFLYNFFSSTLRALGDSKTPLYFLIISALFNVFGDLFFVIVLKLGSDGCAAATVISEVLCCAFCIIYINKKVPILKLKREWLVFDKKLLSKTVSFGWAAAMQQATVQIGKLVISSVVNSMGVALSAAFTAVNRIDDFAIIPEQNIANSMTALMAQNNGAGRKDRMKKGFKYGMLMEVIYGILLFIITFFLAKPLMMLFSGETEVVEHGVVYLHLISFMYIFPALNCGIQGYFRGVGKMKITFLSSFVNMAVRVLAAVVLVYKFSLSMDALPFSYLIGWIFMLLTEVPILIRDYKALRTA